MIAAGLGGLGVGRLDGLSKTLGMYNLLNKPWGPKRARFRASCSVAGCGNTACGSAFRVVRQLAVGSSPDATVRDGDDLHEYYCESHLPAGPPAVRWEPMDRRVLRVYCAEPLGREWTVQCWPDAEAWQSLPNAAGAPSRVLLLFRSQDAFCFEADVTGAGNPETLVFQLAREPVLNRGAYSCLTVEDYSGDLPVSEHRRAAVLTAEGLMQAIPPGGTAYLCDWAGVPGPRDLQVYSGDGRLTASYALGAERAQRGPSGTARPRPEPGAPRARKGAWRLRRPQRLPRLLVWCIVASTVAWVGSHGPPLIAEWWGYRRALNGASDTLLRYAMERPEGRFASAAMLVADRRTWEELRRLPTEETCDAYLEHFPDGDHREQAANVADSLTWRRAVAAGTERAYAEYASKPYASPDRRAIARERAARIAYNQARLPEAPDSDEGARIAQSYQGTEFGDRAAKEAYVILADRAQALEGEARYSEAIETWRRAAGLVATSDATAGLRRCAQRVMRPVEVARENVQVAQGHDGRRPGVHVTRSFLVGFELRNHSRESRHVTVEVLLAAYARRGSDGQEVARHDIALTLGPRETRWVSRTYSLPGLAIDLEDLSKRVRVIDEQPARRT